VPSPGISCLQEPPPQPEPAPEPAPAAPVPEEGLAARARARHAEVHAALARGLTITEIGRTLRLERKTVRRYATAATADQLIPGTRLARPGLLDPHLAYLRQRWLPQHRTTARRTARPRLPGQPAHPAPAHRPAAPRHRRLSAPPPAPAAKKVASWILTPPAKLAGADRAALTQITARCEELTATRALVRKFADMLCHRHGEHLETWTSQAEDSPVSELRGFAKGLRKDWAAVTAGLTVPYSSGAVEGHVNRIMIKRQMYGRAKPDLLRKRVLLAN
jgi:Transposase